MNRQRAQQMNSKQHYRLYKRGKQWVTVCLSSVALVGAFLTIGTTTTQAATTTPAQPQTETTSTMQSETTPTVATQTATDMSQTATTLPQTNDVHSAWLAAVGLALVGFAGFLIVLKPRRLQA